MKYDKITEVNKSIDHIEEVEKANPYHAADGKFTTKGGGASGGGGGGASGGATASKLSGATQAKLGDIVEWRGQPHILISDSGEKNGMIKLRPVSRFGGDSDFDGGGDSLDDVHIDRFQLRDAKIMQY